MRLDLQLWRAAAFLWTLFTVVSFAVVSVLIVREPGFPLGITFVSTHGLAGLWITVPSFLLGAGGLVLLLMRRANGAKLLFVYSAFWAVSMFFAVVEKTRTVIHEPLHVCLTRTCATFPVTLALLAAFVLSFFWYWRQAWPKVV